MTPKRILELEVCLKDNIWTILDHIGSYYNILDHVEPFGII